MLDFWPMAVSQQTCPKCGHGWVPRVDRPQACPVCKRRMVYDEVTAVYIGTQTLMDGTNVRLFTVVGGPYDQSTLTSEGLTALGILVPEGHP